MKLIFAGTPEFSVTILTALINAGHTIVGVYCQPDRPKGRGRILSACPVKEKALSCNLPIFQPNNFNDKNTQAQFKNLNAEVMVVVAFGQLLPEAILSIPKYGCLNIHASLLPRWRGAAPIQRAILAGDKITGIDIIQMNEGLDTGDILLEKTCSISHTDTAQSLHNKLAILGGCAINETLNNLKCLPPTKQSNIGVIYAKKLKKSEAWIDWSQSAVQINQQIKAFNPFPIAQTYAVSNKFDAKVLRILSAHVIQSSSYEKTGNIIPSSKETCLVATGNGILSLKTIQLSGKKVANIKDFNNAYQLTKLQYYLKKDY